MSVDKEKLYKKLNQLLAEKGSEDQVLEQTLALLDKVDQRRREHPEDKRRWDLRADDLEESLLESKHRQTVLEQRVIDVTRKLDPSRAPGAEENFSVDPIVPELPDTATVKAATGGGNDFSDTQRNVQAAQRILDLPLFKLQEAPLQDFVLAKLFIESKESSTMSKENNAELTKRISIYDRGTDKRRQVAHPTESPKERREQMVLREALDKCRKNQMGTLTLDEINVIVACYDILVQQGSVDSSNDRLVSIVNDAIDKICATWSNMENLKKSVKTRKNS